MAEVTTDVRERTRRRVATYFVALLGLGLIGMAVWAASRSLTAPVDGRTAVCGSVFDNPNYRNLLSLDAFFSGREGCQLQLAKAHVTALVAWASGVLTFAVAAVRSANARRPPH